MSAVTTSNSFTRLGTLLGWSATSRHNREADRDEETWYIPYNERPPKKEERIRSRTLSSTSQRSQPSFFSFDSGQADIGQSPRSSYRPPSQVVQPREKASFSPRLGFGNNNRRFQGSSEVDTFHAAAEHKRFDRQQGSGFAHLNLSPTEPLRPRAKSTTQPAVTSGTIKSEQVHPTVGTVNSTPAPSGQPQQSSRHPYALARSPPTPNSAPVSVGYYGDLEPPPLLPPHNLKSSTSTPNLRDTTSYTKPRSKRHINLVAETWCDALVFPRPRLRPHRLSITPPDTPLAPLPPPSPLKLKPLNPANPDAISIASSQDALEKAIREGERRAKEKEQWSSLAAHSFQNNRSRSLSKSRRRAQTGPSYTQNEGHGVKRGLETLAQTAFSQGASTSTSGSSASSGSHSRNTSSTINRNTSVRKPAPAFEQNQKPEPLVWGGENRLVNALSNPERTTKLYVNLPPDVPLLDLTTLELPKEKKTLPPIRASSFLLNRRDSARVETANAAAVAIGIALSTPTAEAPSVSFAGHPYASGNYGFSRLPAGPHPSSPPATVDKFSIPQDIASRHRLPPRGVPPPIPHPYVSGLPAAESTAPLELHRKTGTSSNVSSEPPKPNDKLSSAMQRRSLLGAHAYALDDSGIDETPLGMEEALTRSLKRMSTDRPPAEIYGNWSSNPLSQTNPQAVPSLPKLPPPIRYEPVKFDRYTSTPLETITDVTTPTSVNTPFQNTPSSIVDPSSEQPPADNEQLEQSKDSFPSVSTSDSSPSSEQGPRILSDNDDPELYSHLFYQSSSPPGTPSPGDPRFVNRTSFPTTVSSDDWDERRVSAKGLDGLKALKRRVSEDHLVTPLQISRPRAFRSIDDDATGGWGSRHGGLRGHRDPDLGGNPNEMLPSPSIGTQSVPLRRSEYMEEQHGLDGHRMPDIPEDIPTSPSTEGSSEDDLDFTLRQVEHISMPSITSSVPRPVSTHLLISGEEIISQGTHDLTQPFPAPVATPVLTPSSNMGRDSAYSATTNDSRMSNIISDFPIPPIPSLSELPTPSTVLESYFTADDQTPLQSVEELGQFH